MKILEEKEDKILMDCTFCKGKGLDPFGIMSYRSKCYACNGEKKKWVKKPIKKCPCCKGTGVSLGTSRNYCIVCHGMGVVSISENAIVCPKCKGTGFDASSCYCMKCKGAGMCPDA